MTRVFHALDDEAPPVQPRLCAGQGPVLGEPRLWLIETEVA